MIKTLSPLVIIKNNQSLVLEKYVIKYTDIRGFQMCQRVRHSRDFHEPEKTLQGRKVILYHNIK